MTTAPTTTIEAPAHTQTIRITREFDAPPAVVFAAHTDPEIFRRWVGPEGHTTTIRAWDATTGGRWSYVAEVDGQSYPFFGSFHEVRPDERIVQTFTYEGFPDAVSLETLVLTPLPGGRTLLEATSVFDSVESRDGMVASGMETGVEQGYAKLDALLAEA